MSKSELFLLLPKRKDVTSQPFYIRDREDGPNTLRNIAKSITEVTLFVEIESQARYYDEENIKAFLDVSKTDEDYPMLENHIFQDAMVKWGENWRKNPKQVSQKNYTYYTSPIENDTLCEMTERIILAKDNTYLLINCNAIKCNKGSISTNCDGKEYEIEVRDLEIRDVANWFENNRRPKRNFKLNPKHGEYGKGATPTNKGEKVSVLMCSRQQAAKMLAKAVGEDSRALYFYDDKYGQYIEFRLENKGSCTFHAFHLDEEDANRVPEKVKAWLNELVFPQAADDARKLYDR
ncbi:MAG: hypothetical protein LUC37_02430 [Prevotella sp.]|nr:hypothetical protein [Prevotella sp.]